MNRLPLKISMNGDRPRLELGGIDIVNYVKADSLKVDFVDYGVRTEVEVTMTLGCGRLDLELDVELLEGLLDAARKLVGG